MKEYLSNPPPSWRRHLVDPVARAAAWSMCTVKQKHNGWVPWNLAAKRRHDAVARLERDPSDIRVRNFIERGGQRRYDSPAQSKAAHKECIRASDARRSEATLQFRQLHARGCSRNGCVLSEPQSSEPHHAILLPLLEHDHINREGKVASVTKLIGAARDAELEKTQVLCAWHHFEKTRAESGGGRPVDTRECPDGKKLGLVKLATGCQHPLHASMPYASLVPDLAVDPLVCGFLHVSHITREVMLFDHQPYPSDRARVHLRRIDGGQAFVHCRFCYSLYSLCGRARMYETAFTQQQYGQLLLQAPAFVQHFDECTSGFDWDAERVRCGQAISRGRAIAMADAAASRV